VIVLKDCRLKKRDGEKTERQKYVDAMRKFKMVHALSDPSVTN